MIEVLVGRAISFAILFGDVIQHLGRINGEGFRATFTTFRTRFVGVRRTFAHVAILFFGVVVFINSTLMR